MLLGACSTGLVASRLSHTPESIHGSAVFREKISFDSLRDMWTGATLVWEGHCFFNQPAAACHCMVGSIRIQIDSMTFRRSEVPGTSTKRLLNDHFCSLSLSIVTFFFEKYCGEGTGYLSNVRWFIYTLLKSSCGFGQRERVIMKGVKIFQPYSCTPSLFYFHNRTDQSNCWIILRKHYLKRRDSSEMLYVKSFMQPTNNTTQENEVHCKHCIQRKTHQRIGLLAHFCLTLKGLVKGNYIHPVFYFSSALWRTD